MLPDMAHDGLLVGELARKAGTTRKALVELNEVRKTLHGLLHSWPSLQRGPAAVCRHIEGFEGSKSTREVRDNGETREDDEVRIGEDVNLAVLKAQEWNVLVSLISSGQLTTI